MQLIHISHIFVFVACNVILVLCLKKSSITALFSVLATGENDWL